MRRYFALLTAALLSGCGLTDGPNRTGSAWLDELDLGPQGLESVSVPFRALQIQVMADPAVPAYNGAGVLSVGQSAGFSAVTSFWFDPRDTTRWVRKRPADTAQGSWSLVLNLDTSIAGTPSVQIQTWNAVADTLPFLLGASRGAPDSSFGATLRDTAIVGVLGDSNTVRYGQGRDIGIRVSAPNLESRGIYAVYLVNGKGDTLLPANVDGRAAWGVRWTVDDALAIASTVGAGKRVRILADANTLRSHIVTSLGLPQAASDSFDNTVAIFSARAKTSIANVSGGARARFLLSSWVVDHRDTTELAATSGDMQAAFSSVRTSDGKSLDGVLHVRKISDSLVRISIVAGADSIPFLNPLGSKGVQYHFYLFAGDSVEAPMSPNPNWVKFAFRYSGGKVRFIRTVLSDAVVADDQVEAHDASGYLVYRDEAIANSGSSFVRYEARTAFGRTLNRKAQEVWTDLVAARVSADSSIDDNFRIQLRSTPIDSVTFLVRRRSQGVVQ